MEAKLFEIRDRATFIPILAVKLDPGCEADRYLLARAGYGPDAESQEAYVLLIQIDGGLGGVTSVPHNWGGRTYPIAHEHIIDHFEELEPGDVVDVEYILGESAEPKATERLTAKYASL